MIIKVIRFIPSLVCSRFEFVTKNKQSSENHLSVWDIGCFARHDTKHVFILLEILFCFKQWDDREKRWCFQWLQRSQPQSPFPIPDLHFPIPWHQYIFNQPCNINITYHANNTTVPYLVEKFQFCQGLREGFKKKTVKKRSAWPLLFVKILTHFSPL